MADLVLGFVGGSSVESPNVRALLKDLIAAHHRDHKGAGVRMFLPADTFTPTISDIADFCLDTKQKYKIGLVGHPEDFKNPALTTYTGHTDGAVYRVAEDKEISGHIVSTLEVFAKAGDEVRLILVADPNEEGTGDAAYLATEIASTSKQEIKVRSLLIGLEEIVPESTPAEDEEQSDMATDEADAAIDTVPEIDSDAVDDEDDNDLTEPASDEEMVDAAVAEIPVIDGDEDEYYDIDKDPDAVIPDQETAEEVVPEVAPIDIGADEDLDGVEPDGAQPESKEEQVATATKQRRPNEDQLFKLAERDKEAFYAKAAEYGVKPGRGMKVAVMVRRIFESIDGTAPKPKKAAATKKAAPAKKAAKTTKAAKKAAPTKRATAAKKTAAVATAAPAPKSAPAVTGLRKADIDAIADAVVKKFVSHIKGSL